MILVGIVRVFREMKHRALRRAGARAAAEQPRPDEPVPRPADQNGRPSRDADVSRSALLFGLGFDTATEVALLVLAGGAAGAGLPWYAILCLPILFAAGMSLMDSIDGSFMNFAYGWAFSKPVRKVFYNLTITGLSVAVALVIGTIELGGLIASKLNLTGFFWSWFEHINIKLPRLPDRRDVRPDVGDRPVRVAVRAYRGALVGPCR